MTTGVAVVAGLGPGTGSSLAGRGDTTTTCDGDVTGPLDVATCDGDVMGPVGASCDGDVMGPVGASCDGDVMGPVAVPACDGIVIGPSTTLVGTTTGTVVALGVLCVAGETTMLGVAGETTMLGVLDETTMLGEALGAVVLAATDVTLGASAYGSIGRMSPDGPAYGDGPTATTAGPYGSIGIAEPEGPVGKASVGRGAATGCATSAPELDARGNALAPGRVSSHGLTSHRPAAYPAAPPATSHRAELNALPSFDMAGGFREWR